MQTKQIADQKEGKARAGPGKNARIQSRYSRKDDRCPCGVQAIFFAEFS